MHLSVSLFTGGGGIYLGRRDTYLGQGIPTLLGGGTYLDWEVSTLAVGGGVPTLAGGGWVTCLGLGGYLP